MLRQDGIYSKIQPSKGALISQMVDIQTSELERCMGI